MSYADFIREVAGRVGICSTPPRYPFGLPAVGYVAPLHLPAVFGVPPKTFLQCGSIILCGKVVAPALIVSKLTFCTVAHGTASVPTVGSTTSKIAKP